MPTISVIRDELFEKLGENFGSKPNIPSPEADERFDKLCFEFGIELDDVTTEAEIQKKETGTANAKASSDIIYKIDIPANRYDLLCVEGLARALRIFLGKEKAPEYRVVKPQGKPIQKMIVKPSVSPIRPVVLAAVLRNMKFTESNYKSFIDIQEKLHQNICRRRTLVSIGTHDLDTIEGPFTYQALPPKDIRFAPLNNTTVMDGEQLMKHLDNDLHLKKFLYIIRDAPEYPVIMDKNGVVLSLPPIINGNHSKITLNTTNVLIEVTATDLTKCHIVLNTVVSMFSEYCADKFTVEPVEVVQESDGSTILTPDLSTRKMEAQIEYINSCIGVQIESDRVADLLTKMSLTSQLTSDKKSVSVDVPVTRSDILHACDIMEDVAIAYGFNNIPMTQPTVNTEGKQQPLNKLTDMLRKEVAMAGFAEIFTFALCSRDETFKYLNRVDDGSAITIANPQTQEFQVARTSLLVGLLKSISHNRGAPLPLKIFELSDIVKKTDKTDVGAINQRNLCVVHCGLTPGFEIVQGILDRVMMLLRVPFQEGEKSYQLKPSEDPAFFPGRRADIIYNGQKIGVIGVLHPECLAERKERKDFHIPFPCAAFEICIESFL